MRKILVVASLVAVCSACSPRHAAQIAWTIDGVPAVDGCGELGDEVRIKVSPKTGVNEEMADETEVTTVACSAGTADISLGNFSTIYLELLRGGEIVGRGGPLEAQATGGLVGSLNPISGAIELEAEIAVETGFMDISFAVGLATCEEAGVGNVEVQIFRRIVSLDREAVFEDPMTVACSDGLVFDQARVGATYQIEVTSTVGGNTFGTAGAGHRVNQTQAIVATTVNLIDISPPD